MKATIREAISKAASAMGRKGGRAGRGAAKGKALARLTTAERQERARAAAATRWGKRTGQPQAEAPVGPVELGEGCPQCGAVGYGNITCRTCRRKMRELLPGGKSDLLDRLDEIDPETVWAPTS